jgi:hypothetical protein
VDGERVSALAVKYAGIAHERFQEREIAGKLLDGGDISTAVIRFADVGQNKVVTVCEVKMSLRHFAVTQELRTLVNSRICPPRIKVVTERGVAKSDVNSLATSLQRRRSR